MSETQFDNNSLANRVSTSAARTRMVNGDLFDYQGTKARYDKNECKLTIEGSGEVWDLHGAGTDEVYFTRKVFGEFVSVELYYSKMKFGV